MNKILNPKSHILNSRFRSGQVMILVSLSLGGALLGATVIAGFLTAYQIRQATFAADSAQAIFAADFGVECALYNFFKGSGSCPTCPDTSGLSNDASYCTSTTFTPTGLIDTIVSRGFYKNTTRAFLLRSGAGGGSGGVGGGSPGGSPPGGGSPGGGVPPGGGTPPPAAPSAPSGLTATTISSSQINLSWTDNSTNETEFRVERCVGSGCTIFSQIATLGTSVVSYSNTGLIGGTAYRYRVRACNVGGCSDSNVAEATTALPPSDPRIGVYFWNSKIVGSFNGDALMAEGLRLSKDIGALTLRISMGPKADIDYKGGSCISGSNLAALAARSDFRQFLSDPQFTTVIITAYDWASFPDCNTKNYLNPDFYTAPNTAAIEKEYRDLASFLAQFTGKRFIILNWEGDGDTYNDDIDIRSANLDGYVKWSNARHVGIHSSGASNVFSGIEFGGTFTGKPTYTDNPNVLRYVIPRANADYYSYSSYESINISAQELDSDIDIAKSVISGAGKNSSNLFIGEFGFAVGDFGDATVTAQRLKDVATVIENKNVPYGIVWVLIDSPPKDFGMYDVFGNITESGAAIKEVIQGVP